MNLLEDEHDYRLKQRFGCCFNYKRFLLPISVILPCMLLQSIFQNSFYIFLSSFISLLILTWNFPHLLKIGYTRPIYFEDLDESKNKRKRRILYNIELSQKFKRRFIVFQQFMISVTIAIVADYISFKYKLDDYQPMEFFGLVGGVLSLYAKILYFVGKKYLRYLYHKKKKEKDNLLAKFNIESINSFERLNELNNQLVREIEV
tara:strand:+ start:9 stop:620 length:612 start_codon:yes stop_codon:yes gene_type:complete